MVSQALELKGIIKRFGDVVAVHELSIAFEVGEVHALLGENGAGKSTLMNVAAGFLTPDAGEILVAGQSRRFGSPRDAASSGIGMVHQHFRLVEEFTVAENLALGARDLSTLTSGKSLTTRALAIAERFGMPISPDKLVGNLSVGERQRVEILRTLSRGADVLILDEPTAVLTPEESNQLCVNLRSMAASGTTVVFISHKLNEVLAVADRISVMRKGRLFATQNRSGSDVDSLSRMMFDDAQEAVALSARTQHDAPQAEVIRVSHVSVGKAAEVAALSDVTFSVRDHEIVGFVGVAGNGQKELELIVAGMDTPTSGEVVVGTTRITSPRVAYAAGLAHIPEDRLGSGLVPSQPIWRNAILRNYRSSPVARGRFVSTKSAKSYAGDLTHRVDLSTNDVTVLVQHLSGGNAQKLVAGRELDGDRTAVVAVNPTQGLDVKAAAAVRSRLIEARNAGLAVLLISADLDEVLSMSDRICVLYEGRIVGEFTAANADRDAIGRLMGGERHAQSA